MSGLGNNVLFCQEEWVCFSEQTTKKILYRTKSTNRALSQEITSGEEMNELVLAIP